MPKLNSLEVVHQDTNKDQFETLHDILVGLRNSLAVDREIVDGDARVAIENLLEMYVNDKEAFLRSLRTLTAEFKTSEARYEEEILLQASALEALARKTSTLTAQTENNIASVREYSEAVASEVARKTTSYSKDTEPTGDLNYGDLWIDTNNNNKLYSWNGLVWVDISKVATFRQTSEPTGATVGDIWMDTDNNNKMFRWDGSSWVATDDLRIAKTYAKWGIQVDVNGRVAGIQLNSDDIGTSEFTVLADAFRVYNPSISNSEVIFTVKDGVVTPKNLRVNDTSGNWILKVSDNMVGAQLWKPIISMGTAGNLGNPTLAAFDASGTNSHIIRGAATGSESTNHGVRGTATAGGNTSGIVGVANGYDFYADGAGTNYGPFTGTHDALVDPEETIEVGDIVIDAECVAKNGISSALCRITKSTTPNQKGSSGILCKMHGKLADTYPPAVFGFIEAQDDGFGNLYNSMTDTYNELKDKYNYAAMNAIGEGQINVCGENGDIEVGDLIVSSSMPGKGMKQADDVVRSYTVAKAREDATFNSPTEVKQVACIYLCG